MAAEASIESREEYADSPIGQKRYWERELTAANSRLKKWHQQADKIVRRFLDERKYSDMREDMTSVPFRLNLFYSNITTLNSMLYGNLPKVDVSRRYADSNDDVSRVAAETMERLLNNDIADNGKEYDAVLRNTLQDRLLPGLGCARVRYSVETQVDAMGMEQMVSERAPIDYYFWRDVLWSWGRSFADLTWIAFRSYLTKDQVKARFGEYACNNVQYQKQTVEGEESADNTDESADVWQKAEIWEIWDKGKRKVCWYNKGCDRILDSKDDTLKLSGFFPCPPFFIANATTTLYQPTPDYHIAQDLYNEIDELQTRIAIITEAVKVVGVYDKGCDEVGRMFDGTDNTVIPVDNWALFSERGGLKGVIDWFPLADVVAALDKLVALRDQTTQLLHEVTGMADVMRGGGQGQYEGVGQAQLKAKFGSVRVQALQDQFAQFASDLLQLKAEVISRHFDPETIAQQSNMGSSFDAEYLPQAIELIKTPELARLKVVIRPESVAMVDYAQLKAERTDYLNALSTFMQSSAPLMENDPNAKPFLLQLLQWGLSGFKGASEIEGVIDKAIEASQKEQQQQQPDPAQIQQQMQMQAMQAQHQMDMEKLQAQTQADMQKIQAKLQADIQMRQVDLQSDAQTEQAAASAQIAQIRAELESQLTQIAAKMKADIQTELATSEVNAQQQAVATQGEMEKEVVKTELEISKIKADAAAELAKQSAERELEPDDDD